MALTAVVKDVADVLPGHPVLLDGRDSTDATAYSWEILGDARGARLEDQQDATIRFLAAEPGDYRVRLTVTDGQERRSRDAIVSVVALSVRLTVPPEATVGQPVTFTAEAPEAPAGASYAWRFTDPSPDTDPFVNESGATATMLPWYPGRHSVTVTLRIPHPDRAGRWLVLDTATETVEVQAAPSVVDVGDDAWWQDQMVNDTRTALAGVVKAANTWQGYVATLLGLFGTVTIVAGPEAISDLPGLVAGLVLLLTILGFVAAAVGLVMLADVTARAPELGEGMTGAEYRKANLDAVGPARAKLSNSKAVSVGAAACIALGSLLAAGAAAWPTSSTTYVLVRTPDEVYCGELSTKAGKVLVDGQEIGRTNAVTIVDDCG